MALVTQTAIASNCGTRLSLLTPTEGLIVYLTHLMDQRVLKDQQLGFFLSGLKSGELRNPFTLDQTKVDSTTAIHRVEIENYFKKPIDHKKLLASVQQAISERENVAAARSETQHQTQMAYQKMQFHPLPPVPRGHVLWEKRPVALSHSFEVMTTPVTQKQWVDVMGKNPSFFSNGPESVRISSAGNTVTMQPDHPVESVTWWSAIAFANTISKNRGLKPAYDLSEVRFERNQSDGTLVTMEPVTFNMPDAYEAEGYRLPTKAEMARVLELALDTNLDPLNDRDLMSHYGWLSGEANAPTMAVAGLKPFIVNSGELFDLIGNVWEWTSSIPENGSFIRRVVFGRSNRNFADARTINDAQVHFRDPHIGFRLVRTLK